MKMSSTSTVLLLGLLIFGAVAGVPRHNCVHDTILGQGMVKPMLERIRDQKHRILQPFGQKNDKPSWHPLRTHFDWSSANQLLTSTPSMGSKYQMVIRLANSVQIYFGSVLHVNYQKTMHSDGGECMRTKMNPFSMDVDLYTLVLAKNDPNSDYFATSAICYQSAIDGRPTVGAFILNPAFLQTSPLYENFYFSAFGHEFVHILGFSTPFFSSFVIPGTNKKRPILEVVDNIIISQKHMQAIKLPEVLSFAKSYFKCDTIEGIPLEYDLNKGPLTSHWAKAFLPNEFMNPIAEYPGILSGFTYSFLRGTGWYLTKEGGEEYYDWGIGAGCKFFTVCPKVPGSCKVSPKNQDICGVTITGKGACTRSSWYSETCAYFKNQAHSCLIPGAIEKKENEFYGPGSRCINYLAETGHYTTKCHKVSCSGTTLTITVGSQKVTCTQAEGASSTVKFVGDKTVKLQCPETTKYCAALSAACPNDCSSHGFCNLNKICTCFSGWSGLDCSKPRVFS